MTLSFWQGQPFLALSPACWQVSGWNLLSQAGHNQEKSQQRESSSAPKVPQGGVTRIATTCHSWASVLHPCCATTQLLQDSHKPLAHSLHFWGLCFAGGILLTPAGLPMLLGSCTHCISFWMWTHAWRFKPSLKSVRLESKWSPWQGLCHLGNGICLRHH